LEPRNVPFNYCYRWLNCSIKVSEKYYTLFLGCGLLYFFTITAIGFIPYLGTIASLFLMFLYSLANMRLSQKIRHGGTAVFDDYLKLAFDPVIFEKFVPFLVMLFAISFTQVVSTVVKMTFLMLTMSFVNYFVVTIAVFASYMMLQDSSLDWKTASLKVMRGLWMNVLPTVAGWFIFALFAGFCALLCFVPFLLYFLPMTLPLSYLIYSSIFEGLDVDKTIAEWSSKNRAAELSQNS